MSEETLDPVQPAPAVDLAELRAEAARLDAPPVTPEQAKAADTLRDEREADRAELREVVDGGLAWIVSTVDGILDGAPKEAPQSLGEIFTPEVRGECAEAIAKVATKWGITFPKFASKWAPEIELLILVGMLAPPTAALIQAKLAAPGPEPAPEPGRSTAATVPEPAPARAAAPARNELVGPSE